VELKEIDMFVCIENGVVVSILDYQPNVPNSVTVAKITKEQYDNMKSGTHVFDVESMQVKPAPDAQIAKKEIERRDAQRRHILESTDWQVLRHIRQKALGIPTTLSDDKYIELESLRQQAAQNIQSKVS
jgi:hypothetical protein